MRYAILGPQKDICWVSDTDSEPEPMGEMTTVVQITDEQAAQVEAGYAATPMVFYFLIDGALMTFRGKVLVEHSATMTPEQKIQAGEEHIFTSRFSAARLVTLMDLLIQTKEAGALESKPKLVALYTWLQTVKGMAIAGSVMFPPAPHTFEEVVAE